MTKCNPGRMVCDNCGAKEGVFRITELLWTCIDCQGGHFNEYKPVRCSDPDCLAHNKLPERWAHTHKSRWKMPSATGRLEE